MKTIEEITDAKRAVVDMRQAVYGLHGMEKAEMLRKILAVFETVKGAGEVRELVSGEPRVDTARFYGEKKRGISRQKLNDEAMAIVRRVESGEIKNLSDEDKATLAQYTGCGGGLIRPDGKKGSAYEYYTPKAVAEGVWDVLNEMGFTGGRVLDPCAGTGIFGATSPRNCAIDAVELSEFSGKVNSLINDGPGYMTRIGPFEDFAANTNDGVYDAVVTNVPFGTVADRGANAMLDTKYRDQPLEVYFILRALQKVRPGGMAAFIAPTRCVSGKDGKQQNMRIEASLMAEFLGAYRLPSGTFSAADTDTVTDILFFKRFTQAAEEKIRSMFGPKTKDLKAFNVLWEPFVSGDYFKTPEGQKYVLGETTMTKNRFGDTVETVLAGTKDGKVNPSDIKDLMKVKRLPGSRIDWKALDASEAQAIIYKDGDTIRQAGCTLQMQNGVWVQIAKDNKAEVLQRLETVNSAYRAFEANVTYQEAKSLYDSFTAGGHEADLPRWFRSAMIEVSRNTAKSGDKIDRFWKKAVIALAVEQVLLERAEDVGCNYILAYPKLSTALKTNLITKTDIKAAGLTTARAMQVARNQYPSKKEGYSAIWRGDVEKEVKQTQAVKDFLQSPEAQLANLAYTRRSLWLRREEVEQIYGPGFDPIGDNGWAVNAQGDVCRASDYYYGNYAEFTQRLDDDIKNAASEEIKRKLLSQKTEAETRLRKFDASRLEFNFRSPYLSEYDKLEFLRNFVTRSAFMRADGAAEYASVRTDVKARWGQRNDKLLNCFDAYLKSGTVSLGNTRFYDKYDTPTAQKAAQEKALGDLREMLHKYNSQLNDWVHANSEIMDRINERANKPENLFFKDEEDGSAFVIPGLKTTNKDGQPIGLHDYQNAFVRKMGHSFEGVNAFGVGLGKTFTALAAVQHVQAMGAKKKTIFVVPNAVLSNWRKEAETIYADTSDCLYVGLRVGKGGKAKVDPGSYAEDLLKIRENRHSKIFMSMTAFELLRLKDTTLNAYGEYLRQADKSLWPSDDEKEEQVRKARVAKLLTVGEKKKATAPYLEDLGVDSIVIDEAHFFKNSTNAYDFTGKGAVSMSISAASKRGIDAQIKAWYIRGANPLHDGVLLLTATPITNSPQECYSMMALAVGNERVNKACGGISGADDFLDAVCDIQEQETPDIKGDVRVAQTFMGLQNTDIVRSSLLNIATIKGAEEVGAAKFVARETAAESIDLPEDTYRHIAQFKDAYEFAQKLSRDPYAKPKSKEAGLAFSYVSERFGMLGHAEDTNIMASPFNLIRKMQNEILDPDINEGVTIYTFADTDAELAAEVRSEWNAMDVQETRSMLSRFTDKKDVISMTKKPKDDDAVSEFKMDDDDSNAEKGTTFTYYVRAFDDENQMMVDTKSYDVQTKFEALCAKRGLKLDVIASPKESALAANVNKEMASPRGLISRDPLVTSPIVKQLIFCDSLAIHNKIRRILERDCGIPAAKIAVVTGQTNNEPEQLLEVQNGFNAQGDDNKYQIIIANKKAEVGLNLQKGTQAIHHLTIGWTPDSIEQRNGRGARQGNATETVRLYFYDAAGTFDEVKRAMVSKKADWIGEVTNENGANRVAISGRLTARDYETLAELSQGGADAVKKFYEQREAEEKAAHAEATRKAQLINIETVVQQRNYLERNQTNVPLITASVRTAWKLFIRARNIEISVAKREKTDDKAVIAKRAQEVAKAWKLFDEAAVEVDGTFNFGKLGELDTCRKVFDYLYPENYTGDDPYGYLTNKFELKPREDGILVKRWERKVNDAKNMIKTSASSFEQRSSEEGGYPACVAKAIETGNVAIVNGFPIIPGVFFETEDGLFLVKTAKASASYSGEVSYEINSIIAYTREGYFSTSSRAPFSDTKLIYPDNPDYQAYLKKAAEIEVQIEADRRVRPDETYSAFLPEIAEIKKGISVEIRGGSTFRLKPPLFPWPIAFREGKGTKIWKKLANEQSSVIELVKIEWTGAKFRILDDSRIEVGENSLGVSEILAALMARAKADGEELYTEDMKLPGTRVFANPVDDVGRCLREMAPLSDDEVRAIYEGLTQPDNGYAKLARRTIAKAGVPFYPDDYAEVGSYIARPYICLIESACRENYQKEREAAEKEREAQEASLYANLKDNDEVILSGNTYSAKDAIKDCAIRLGGRAQYKKYGVPGYESAGNNVWVVEKQAWELLQKEYPDFARILKMTPVKP